MRYRYDDEDEMPQSLEDFGEQIKAELREEYTVQRNQEQFWNEFYSANPELRADRHVVLAVWQENIDHIMNSTAANAMAFLATESEKRVTWLKQTEGQRREMAVMVGGPGFEGMSANDHALKCPKPWAARLQLAGSTAVRRRAGFGMPSSRAISRPTGGKHDQGARNGRGG